MLRLSGDTASAAPTIDAYLRDRAQSDPAQSDPARAKAAEVIAAIASASVPLARRLAQGELPGDPKRKVGVNSAGDSQKALDMAAHDHFVAVLIAAGVRAILSEEAEDMIPGAAEGLVSVAIDPIDGSGSIGIGAPLGTLFAIYPASDAGDEFRMSGRSLLAAGYVSFGHSVDFGFSLGDGVVIATLDPASNVFRVVVEDARLPLEASEIAYNASLYWHWRPGVQAYVDDCLAGRDGPRERDFNMRWLAAAVGELHRILRRGGMFFYVADKRKGYREGRLRLIYEAVPIAFLCEAAGGAATDGARPILDLVPETLHQNIPLVFGCADEVATFATYAARDN
ncbi:MAG: class 1 fructose-bisphosphatase [Rhodobacteraceae bacterium]|nr:class 1 fructose-bisphosphatase [Paracoccaceae bacterium]